MKLRIAILIAPVLCFSLLHAQSTLCENSYMPFKEGVSFELSSYSKKDKLASVVRHEIQNIESSSGKYVANVRTEIRDDKGEKTLDGTYQITCTGDGVGIDMSTLLNQESMAAFSSMDVDISGDALIFPNNLTPGETLPDGEMVLQASMGGMSLMKLHMKVMDRKVEASENVTTPAGTFDCLKITQTTSIEGFGNQSYKSTSWYAKGVGMVRTENYDKKGELNSYTLLTAFSK